MAKPSAPVLQLHQASAVKEGRRVLDRLTLTIAQGQHTAILGPNGAGKSSLVNLLTHLDRPLSEDQSSSPSGGAPPPVRVFGRDRWNVFELRARLGIVSADLHHRFVRGNSEGRISAEAAVLSGFLASQGILRYGAVTDLMRQRARAALARLGVAHLAERQMHQMSSGEARRVMLARALVTAPWALVLDEPTSDLDLVARQRFLEAVGGIAREGTTLVLITHHVEEIVPEVTQVVLLQQGRIVGVGPTREMLTSERLSRVFDAPIQLVEHQGRYAAHV